MSSRAGSLCWIGASFLVGFGLVAALILSRTRADDEPPRTIPLSERLDDLTFPLLGPYAIYTVYDHVGGEDLIAATWTACLLLGIWRPRSKAAVTVSCIAAATWSFFGLFPWSLGIT